MQHVPYNGTGPQLTDLLAGRLEAASAGAPALMQHIKTGKLRCIATGTAQRLPQLPDVPTVAEQGYPGFEMTQWYGLLAPAKTPPAIIKRLAAEAAKAAKSRLGARAASGGRRRGRRQHAAASTREFIAKEQARWKEVIQKAGVKAD